jgi:hypothetical protein
MNDWLYNWLYDRLVDCPYFWFYYRLK